MECRVSLAVWLSLAGAVAASCGGNSTSHIEDRDDDGGASGGNAGSSGESGGNATGGSANGGGGASSGSAGDGGAVPCTGEVPPSDVVCNGDLTGTWIAKSCSLRVSGVVDLSNLGFPTCLVPVVGSLQVSGSVTFDGETYSDDTITTGETTFELEQTCLLTVTCDDVGMPLQALGYKSVRCVPNEATLGCTCVGKVEQSGGLGFISIDASTYGTYATSGKMLTLTTFGDDTEYASCVWEGAESLSLSLVTVAKTGTVADPLGFKKQ